MKTLKYFLVVLTIFVSFKYVLADDGFSQTQYKGSIKNIDNSKAEVVVSSGDKKGQSIEVFLDQTVATSVAKYKVGDKVFVLGVFSPETGEYFYITDHDRSAPLLILFLLFLTTVIVVSKKWGILSLLGMLYSFFIIFKFILPLLLKGYSPLLVAVTGAALISPVTFYLSHGVNRKTTVALLSTLITLFITSIIALIFINFGKLTGFGSDDAFFLQIAQNGAINMKGILLAGIIIGALGILDDVTISQSAIVAQLKHAVPNISDIDLYKKAMDIGHDHIASTVNTLVLVYTGAALPLLLMFLNASRTFSEAVNTEMIADEIVRTLVGSIGLVLAVPISTILAVFFTTPSHEDHKHRN